MEPSDEMTSSRPYLIRALYEWIVDNNLTPHLLANADYPEVVIPRQYVEDGKIVLNINPGATSGMVMGNDFIEFAARFGGKSMNLVVPIEAVLAIYARENGQGMMFPEDGGDEPNPPDKSGGGQSPSKSRSKSRLKPKLKLVK